MTPVYRNISWVVLFAISMAFLESSVVVYLRAIYYPNGFEFPLTVIDNDIGITEIIREAATIIMLCCIGIIVGKKAIEKFAFFLLAFAVWDIFYYVFLKLLLGWPESFLTWDILFLIPFTWVGPVMAPIINSLIMIALAIGLIHKSNTQGKASPGIIVWLLLIIGSIITLITYMSDYVGYMMKEFSFMDLISYRSSENILERASLYVPSEFNWLLFTAGQLLFVVAVIVYVRRKS